MSLRYQHCGRVCYGPGVRVSRGLLGLIPSSFVWLMRETLHVLKITPRRNRDPPNENCIKEHFYLLWPRLFRRHIFNTNAVCTLLLICWIFPTQLCPSDQTAYTWLPTGVLLVKLANCSFLRNIVLKTPIPTKSWHFRKAVYNFVFKCIDCWQHPLLVFSFYQS